MDPEIKAMSDIAAAVSSLEPEAIRRVLKWAVERFQVRSSAGTTPGDLSEGSNPAGTFNSLAELYDAANPSSGLEKILAVAYWFQVQKGQDEWDSFVINKELKHMGHQSGNITRDLDTLINKTPRLVLQVRKEGTTKQARKRYKLTREGTRVVEKLLAGASNETAP